MKIGNFSEFLLEKDDKKKEKGTSQSQNPDENKAKTEDNTDPDLISKSMEQCVACLNGALSCLERISRYTNDRGKKSLADAIKGIENDISKISGYKKYIIVGEGENKEISKELNFPVNQKYIDFYEGDDGIIKKIKRAKGLVDDGEITQKEWEDNVEKYSRDADNEDVTGGSALKSTMYQEVKEAFGLLQSAIDNYVTGENDKNALSQYLKAYKGFTRPLLIAKVKIPNI